ncbi:unnamed protein product [Spirodela intermedia]|uniref:E3 ubiquitin-protein ligase RMA n=1 Tax=Spirodela intermedia TaxID=51605 RepID=A0A7I8IE47_SPIIN|nr:unnamed protein product [Spirodela intermedia]CAA6655654.1 unnamed protein product [Spirodela intermedia]
MDAESERQLLPNQEPPSKVERDLAPPTANACFDCNICLDFAVEPVVTLCGHLYCWPCIYKWLCQESATAPQCPVCKAALSPATLVPLYGRGCSSEGDKAARGAQDIPRRPPAHAASLRSRRHLSYGHDADFAVSSSSTAAGVLHPSLLSGTAVAVLPWVLGDEWVALYTQTHTI